jgi:hypothetical protein
MEVSGQLHAPADLTSGQKVPVTHWTGGWVGPRFGLDAAEKIKIFHCQELNPYRPFRRYTYRAILAPMTELYMSNHSAL